MGMPRNTIQIRLRRIRISLHSAGCSSTKRVMIWNMPSALATTSMKQAPAMDSPLVKRSMRRKLSFTVPSFLCVKRPACAGPFLVIPGLTRDPRLRARCSVDCGARNDIVFTCTARILSRLALPNCFSNSALTGASACDELGLVDVVDHGHALGAQVGHALGVVLVHAGAVGLGGFLGGFQEGRLVGGRQLVEAALFITKMQGE
jgi:hypothetical protein